MMELRNDLKYFKKVRISLDKGNSLSYNDEYLDCNHCDDNDDCNNCGNCDSDDDGGAVICMIVIAIISVVFGIFALIYYSFLVMNKIRKRHLKELVFIIIFIV